jgi:hypothetical protein
MPGGFPCSPRPLTARWSRRLAPDVGGDLVARGLDAVDVVVHQVAHEHGGERGAQAAAAGVQFLWSAHSMTWSARASSDGGIVRPRALADRQRAFLRYRFAGSIPLALMTAIASGVHRNLISALAASTCLAPVSTPAANINVP